MKMPITSSALAFLAALSVSACAFEDRQANLTYPPKPESGGAAADAPATATARADAPLVTIVRFDDQRAEKEIVGQVSHSFGVETADVVSSGNVSDWVTNGLKWELEKAGYRVNVVNAPASAASSLLVTGTVVLLHSSANIRTKGLVMLRARIGNEKMDRSYEGHSVGAADFFATEEVFSRALSLALQDGLRKIVADIAKALGDRAI
ncbi:MAG: hypothetical protein WD767_12955 [Alphaproteobacteria bacterium]